MNIISSILSRFGYEKAKLTPSSENLTALQNIFSGIGAGQGFGYGAEEGVTWMQLCDNYKNWVYTCVDKKAKTIAGLPFDVFTYQSSKSKKYINARPIKHYIKQKGMNPYERRCFLKQEGMERVRVTDHPLVSLLRKPNEKDVRFTFVYNLICHLELAGSVGIWKVRNGMGMPVELWALPLSKNGTFKPIAGTDRLIGSYQYTEGSRVTNFKTEDVIWPYYPNPSSPFSGMSAVKAQTWAYDIHLFLMQQQYYFLKNGATSANVFTTENDRLTKPQVDDLKALIKSQYEDIKKRGKAMFLHSGLKQDKPFGFPTKDLIPTQVERLVRDMQLSAFDMPAGKLGLVEDVNRASLDAVNDMFMSESVRFTTMLLEEFLEEYLCPEFDDRLTLDFELPSPNERDTDLKERELNVKNGVTTINEEREKMDKEPVAWGDVPPPAFFGAVQAQVGEPPINEPPAKQITKTEQIQYKDIKNEIWKAFVQHVEQYEPEFKKTMHEFWSEQCNEVTLQVTHGGKSILGAINGWSRDKKRRWLSEHKDKVDDLNIDKGDWNKKLSEAVKPIYHRMLNETGTRRLDNLLHSKARAQSRFRFNVNDPNVEKWLGEKLETFSAEVNGTTFDDIEATLRESFQEGEGVSTIADKLRDTFAGYDKWRALNIARTETLSASNYADLEAVRQTGLAFKKSWLNEPDARDTHKQAGEIYDESGAIDLDDEFKVGDDSMDAPGNGDLAEENCNCFLPETLLYSPDIRAIFKSKFDGKVIIIKTSNGHNFTCTPNHPILTMKGWVKAKFLQEGDCIVSSALEDWLSLRNIDIKNRPTSFKEKFTTLSKFSKGQRIHGCSVNFYGDRPDGDVDIIRIDGKLLNGGKSGNGKSVENFSLTASDFCQTLLFGERLVNTGLDKKRAGFISKDIVRGSSQPLLFDNGSFGHAEEHGLAPVSLDDTSFVQPINDDVPSNIENFGNSFYGEALIVKRQHSFNVKNPANMTEVSHSNVTMSENGIQTGTRNIVSLRNLSNSLSIPVFCDEIIDVHSSSYCGDVYTAETHKGIYMIDGAIAKNCRCAMYYTEVKDE